MLTTNSNRYVLVLRALATVATPLLAGCSPVESARADATAMDARSADSAPTPADSGVNLACAHAELEPWAIEDLMRRGYCAGPSNADPPFASELSGDAGLQDGMVPEPVVGRPCTVLAASCIWSGGMRGSDIGYSCNETTCGQDGAAPLAWTMMRLAGGPMAPPELES